MHRNRESGPTDAEITLSFIAINGSGIAAFLVGVTGGLKALLAIPLLVIFLAGWGRAFGGNLLWRDID